MLNAIVERIRNYEGVTRKHPIKDLTESFKDIDDYGNTVISFGDDSAVIASGDEYLLFAADGIWARLMENDPVWAGYCAVLANVNDIYAMGGRPLALTNIMSLKDIESSSDILKGIAMGCNKFKVPMVGGHLHPQTEVLSLSVSIIGKASSLITSFDAKPGQDILVAIDTTGEQHNGFYNWDSTSKKDSETVVKRLQRLPEIAEKGLATGGKDISNPGILGTIGMLLETSRVGGIVDIDTIPSPKEVDFLEWLLMYPGFGFTLTCDPKNTQQIIGIFEEENVECKKVGTVTDTRKLIIKNEHSEKTLFDFETDIITGVTKRV